MSFFDEEDEHRVPRASRNPYAAAEGLGVTLGLIARHGATGVQDAVQACRAGKATPIQQKIVAQLLDAVARAV